MKFNRLSRRHFLQGAGGFTLSLPFLPSIMPRDVLAEVPADGKFFIFFSTSHGGLNPLNWSPDTRNYNWAPSEQSVMYSGDAMLGLDHRIRHKPLNQLLTGGRVSSVFHSGYNTLLPKMNIIEGLGILFGHGHQSGAFLGNMHGNSNRDFRTGVDSSLQYVPPVPTLDQILAESPNFYPTGGPQTARILNLGGGESPSFRFLNGTVQPNIHWWGIRDIFNHVFGDTAGTQADPNRITMLNRVYEDYQRLMSPGTSNGARLSADDAQAIEQTMDSISEVQQRIANLGVAGTCNTVGIGGTRYGATDPIDNQNAFHQATRQLYATHWSTYVDLIVTAINCGLCRIYTIPIGSPSDYQGDYHQNVAHQWDQEPAQAYIRDAHEFVSSHFILPMLTRLNDVRTIDGGTLLDNGLVVWQHECWWPTHELKSIPTMMAGSLNGFFRTGYYLDYRNLSNSGLRGSSYNGSSRTFDPNHPYYHMYPGVPINQWLHTIFQGMGISRNEYIARSGIPAGTQMYGYGDHTLQQGYTSLNFHNTIGGTTQYVTHEAFPSRVILGANNPLPFLVA